MGQGCRILLLGKSFSSPACRVTGNSAVGLLLRLLMVVTLASPAAGDTDAEGNETAGDQVERERVAPAKEVRPALARRKRNALSQFDPKVFEARGRELRDEYYEITTLAQGNSSWSTAPNEGSDAYPSETGTPAPKPSSSKNWMIWSGAAGLAAVVGGTAGYLLFEKHTAPDPITVRLDDDPDKP